MQVTTDTTHVQDIVINSHSNISINNLHVVVNSMYTWKLVVQSIIYFHYTYILHNQLINHSQYGNQKQLSWLEISLLNEKLHNRSWICDYKLILIHICTYSHIVETDLMAGRLAIFLNFCNSTAHFGFLNGLLTLINLYTYGQFLQQIAT